MQHSFSLRPHFGLFPSLHHDSFVSLASHEFDIIVLWCETVWIIVKRKGWGRREMILMDLTVCKLFSVVLGLIYFPLWWKLFQTECLCLRDSFQSEDVTVCWNQRQGKQQQTDRQRHWAAGIIGINYSALYLDLRCSDSDAGLGVRLIWWSPFLTQMVSVWCGELIPSQTSLCAEANKAPQNTAAVCRNCLSRQREPSWLWNVTLKGL